MDEPRRSGLRDARRDRGWTQEEAADQLARLAWVRRSERVGVNADMIAKWERGDKNPSARYRELLCLLYGATPEYLGIARVTKNRTSPSPEPASPAVTERSLVDALGGAAAILDQLGTAGGILAPRMFDAWKDDVMQRRAMLKLMGIMPAVTVLPSVAESARRSRSGKPTPDNVRDMEYLADRYQTLYHSTAPAALMTPVVAHLSTLGDLLRQDPGPAERRRLLANRARVGTLAGRLSFFDLQDSMAARAYYSLALEAAREADDHLQAAAALAHVAFIPAAEHGFSAALDYLHGASDHLRSQPCGPIASWLAAVESEMHTNAGQPHHRPACYRPGPRGAGRSGAGSCVAVVRLLRRHTPSRVRRICHSAGWALRRRAHRAEHRARQTLPLRSQTTCCVPHRPRDRGVTRGRRRPCLQDRRRRCPQAPPGWVCHRRRTTPRFPGRPRTVE